MSEDVRYWMRKPISILLIALSFFCSSYIYAETDSPIEKTDALNEYAINDQLIIDLKDAPPSTVESLLKYTLEQGASFDNYKKMILLVGKHSNSDHAIENIKLLLKYGYKPYPFGQEYGGEEEYYTLLEWATQNNKTQIHT